MVHVVFLILFEGQEFDGDRSPESVKSMLERSFKTVGWIYEFEGFAGNSGGEVDLSDPPAILKGKFGAARKGVYLSVVSRPLQFWTGRCISIFIVE
jgi:hypothetical protein